MTLIGSNFGTEASAIRRRCSECKRWIAKGQLCLISRRSGVVKKVVCSEECRKTFDDRYWQDRAWERQHAQA